MASAVHFEPEPIVVNDDVYIYYIGGAVSTSPEVADLQARRIVIEGSGDAQGDFDEACAAGDLAWN